MDKYISSGSMQYLAFNIWSIESAKAVMDAASRAGCDIILQTSMKAFGQLDKEEFCAFVRSYGRKNDIRAYLHLDHCRNLDLIDTAVSCGWDSVMIDASDRPLDENIRITNEVSSIAKAKGVLVEAEVGQICGWEDGMDTVAAGIAEIRDIERFIKHSDIDMIAAAIGTVHGQYRGVPDIRYDMIDAIGRITEIPFVVHGGSGLTKETLLRLLAYKNVKKINLSTDVKLAYRRGIEDSIHAGAMGRDGFDPLRVAASIHDAIQNMAADKLGCLDTKGAIRS